MALFGNNDDKQNEKLEKLMKKYELEGLNSKYQNAIVDINRELAGKKLMEVGNTFAPSQQSTNIMVVSYLNTLIQQNWIIIRMLDDLLKK